MDKRVLIKCPKNLGHGYISLMGKKFKGFEFGRRKVLKSWTRCGSAIQRVIKFFGDTVIT